MRKTTLLLNQVRSVLNSTGEAEKVLPILRQLVTDLDRALCHGSGIPEQWESNRAAEITESEIDYWKGR